MSSSPQINYDCFDELITELRASGHAETADKLDFILHRVAWTTGSELLGELGAEILRFQRNAPSGSPDLEKSMTRSMEMVRRVWPEIRLQNE
jgi:hypothetical protein